MSAAEDDITPTTTGGVIPATQTTVPVTLGPLTMTDSGTIPKLTAVPAFDTSLGPRDHDGILYQQIWSVGQSCWPEVGDRCTRECSNHRLEVDEEYDVDAQVEELERGQQEMKRDLKEVSLAIPDMVI
ncbi:UNVERIFIED_CONTAM: hypothetical protein K2H54_004456 [Gekko kuhli]